MPKPPVNKPLTANESVQQAFREIDKYLALGLCEACALKLVCAQHDITYHRLLALYLDRDLHAED